MGSALGNKFRYSISSQICSSVLAAAVLVTGVPLMAAEESEIAEIRRLITELQADYELRIADLERRLEAAERAASATAISDVASRQVPSSSAGSVTAGNAFNPQISVILDGNFYRDDFDGEAAALLADIAQPSGAAHAGHANEHGSGPSNGLQMRSGEIAFSGSVDPYFDAQAYFTIEGDEVDLEEAWFATRNLPAGLRLKGGKFFSEFGYLNNRHEHQWDFVDQNLAYLNLLGDHGLQDTGIQLTWLPELPVYALFGTEILDGDQERLGVVVDDSEERVALNLDGRDDGPRLWTLFAKLSPDLGFDHALQLGGSYVHSRQHQEIHIDPLAEIGLEGEADLWALDLVYKYDNPASYGHRDLSINAEYLRSIKDLVVTNGGPFAMGASRKLTTDGMYVQGVYGIAPRWQAGLRYDKVGGVNRVTGDVRESLAASDRWSTALTWTPTEFSRFRMQYSRSDILTRGGERERLDTFWLQFLMSLGAHGAHRF